MINTKKQKNSGRAIAAAPQEEMLNLPGGNGK